MNFSLFIYRQFKIQGLVSPQLHDATPNQNQHQITTTMTIIKSHTNATGATYYSTTDENGQMIYSFTPDFEDIWTQGDEDAIEAGSTPSKI
jgi:hypothetical protein